MIIALAMLCGAVTSAAWVASRPLCYAFGLASFGLFIVIKGMQ
jgi:hypothetical protein